jgi:hypothetical protein
MPETPKKDQPETRPLGSVSLNQTPDDDPDAWEADQKQHEYYYDDAYGYETYKDTNSEDDQDGEV